jgi:DNA-binding NarL/FixJ family response regulator
MATTLLIYEDNDQLRESVSNLVEMNDQLELLQAFPHVNEVEAQVVVYQPDLIIMDIEMPGLSGIDATRLLRKKYPDIGILILTVFDDSENILNAIKAGASGYLLKKHIVSRLHVAIEDILDGGAPMSPAVARLVLESMHKKNQASDYGLTQREKEVLLSLSKGNSFKMIAAEYIISIDTVRAHIKKIYEKLQVHSQTEAVSKAINEGLV